MARSGGSGREVDLDATLARVARHLGGKVELLDARAAGGRLESLTLRVALPGREPVQLDVAHVETFESSTWEVPPPDLNSLVGARGHTLHRRRGRVEFRLATWVDAFDAATIAVAVSRRLGMGDEPAAGDG